MRSRTAINAPSLSSRRFLIPGHCGNLSDAMGARWTNLLRDWVFRPASADFEYYPIISFQYVTRAPRGRVSSYRLPVGTRVMNRAFDVLLRHRLFRAGGGFEPRANSIDLRRPSGNCSLRGPAEAGSARNGRWHRRRS